MCGRYQFSADEYKEIRQIVRDAQRRSEGNKLNFPMAGDICPSQVCWFHAGRKSWASSSNGGCPVFAADSKSSMPAPKR